ncbi:putative ABC transporter permease [bacterium]|nr:putative ABC transporter permease [bacterium]
MVLSQLLNEGYIDYQMIENAVTGNQLLFLFFLYSLLGWMLETAYRSVSYGRFFNAGFLTGPLVPLYGNAGVFITLTIIITQQQSILIRLAIYFTVITGMEFITGEVMVRLFKRRYWDYSDNLLNVRGHVCLPYSIAWAVLSLGIEKTIYPLSMLLIGHMRDQQLMLINGVGILMLQADIIYSSGIWYLGRSYLNRKMTRYWPHRVPAGIAVRHLLTSAPEWVIRLGKNRSAKFHNLGFKRRKR